MDVASKKVKGVGKASKGLYYLVNYLIENIHAAWIKYENSRNFTSLAAVADRVPLSNITSDLCELWHYRIRYAPASKL